MALATYDVRWDVNLLSAPSCFITISLTCSSNVGLLMLILMKGHVPPFLSYVPLNISFVFDFSRTNEKYITPCMSFS